MMALKENTSSQSTAELSVRTAHKKKKDFDHSSRNGSTDCAVVSRIYASVSCTNHKVHMP